MTDNEIIKALKQEIHLVEYVDGFCADNVDVELLKSTLALINRQKAEIERLEGYNANLEFANQDVLYTLETEIKKAKTEATREFAERLCRDIRTNHVNGNLFVSDISYNWITQEIDNLVKEMEAEDD